MSLILRQGKMGMGVEPALMTCQVINRVGTGLVQGDVLMLDMDNTAYDNDADDGGIFGNGITPAASGTSGSSVGGIFWPYVATTSGTSTASGTRVDAVLAGICKVRCKNTSGHASAKGQLLRITNAAFSRNPEIDDAITAATSLCKRLGFNLEAHGAGATVTSVNCLFYGLDFSGFTA